MLKKIIMVLIPLFFTVIVFVIIKKVYYTQSVVENLTEKHLNKIFASPASLEKHYGIKLSKSPPLKKEFFHDYKKTTYPKPNIKYPAPETRVTITPDKIVVDNLSFYESIEQIYLNKIDEHFSVLLFKEIPMEKFSLLENFNVYNINIISELEKITEEHLEISRKMASFVPELESKRLANLIFDERTPAFLIKKVIETLKLSGYESFIITAKWNENFSNIYGWNIARLDAVLSANIFISYRISDGKVMLSGYDGNDYYALKDKKNEVNFDNSYEEISNTVGLFLKDDDESWFYHLDHGSGDWANYKTVVFVSDYEETIFNDLVPLLRVLGESIKGFLRIENSCFEIDSLPKSKFISRKAMPFNEFLKKRKGKYIRWFPCENKNIYNKCIGYLIDIPALDSQLP